MASAISRSVESHNRHASALSEGPGGHNMPGHEVGAPGADDDVAAAECVAQVDAVLGANRVDAYKLEAIVASEGEEGDDFKTKPKPWARAMRMQALVTTLS